LEFESITLLIIKNYRSAPLFHIFVTSFASRRSSCNSCCGIVPSKRECAPGCLLQLSSKPKSWWGCVLLHQKVS